MKSTRDSAAKSAPGTALRAHGRGEADVLPKCGRGANEMQREAADVLPRCGGRAAEVQPTRALYPYGTRDMKSNVHAGAYRQSASQSVLHTS